MSNPGLLLGNIVWGSTVTEEPRPSKAGRGGAEESKGGGSRESREAKDDSSGASQSGEEEEEKAFDVHEELEQLTQVGLMTMTDLPRNMCSTCGLAYRRCPSG
jgi:hypothetical protein